MAYRWRNTRYMVCESVRIPDTPIIEIRNIYIVCRRRDSCDRNSDIRSTTDESQDACWFLLEERKPFGSSCVMIYNMYHPARCEEVDQCEKYSVW